nr:hypothetical protein [Tanacetum cinerariifolium]
RNALERLGQVAGQRGRGLVIDEHLKVAGAAHGHVAFAIHGQQRRLAQHVLGGATRVADVLVGVVDKAVGLHFYHGFLAHHHGFGEGGGGGRQPDGTQRGGPARHGHGQRARAVAHVAHAQPKGTGRQLGERKLAGIVGS